MLESHANSGENPVIILRDAARGGWLRFSHPQRILVAHHTHEVVPRLLALQDAIAANGLYAAGFVSYEAAPAFDPALSVRKSGGLPLLWFGLYPEPEPITLPQPNSAVQGPEAHWRPDMTLARYRRRLERIRALLRAGAVYQVNLTHRLQATFHADPWLLFLRLAAAEQPPYGAYVNLGDWVLGSLSPELFFRLDGDRIESRPMKGTAARGLWYEHDRQQAELLRASAKERAENLMIVDMARNDLGRIAEYGSVRVPALFTVEQYRSVWQMTSTVRARTGASLAAIFAALFPPASITGAPKPRAMAAIAALESTPRQVYTGSIGFIAPERRAQFNVAIRTLLIDRRRGRAEYGVGGGIVWDSQPDREWRECRAKARVLRPAVVDFDLLETMLWMPETGYFLLSRHLLRLARSAAYFRFAVELWRVRRELALLAARLPKAPHRVRLRASKKGALAIEPTPLDTSLENQPSIVLARAPIDPSNPFLYHKTTNRSLYQEARAARPDYPDVLLYNQQGEITESTLANVVVEIGGEFYTPPLRCGLLPGTYRAWLLERRRVQEKSITRAEALSGAKVYLINSVRGMRRVRLIRAPEDEA